MSDETEINDSDHAELQDAGGTDDPPRLIRPEAGRLLLGVADGLGRYFRVDPVIVRIAFVVGLFFSGIGLIAYLALALFVPAGDDANDPDLRAPYQEKPWLGAIGGSLLVLALVPSLHGGFWHWGPFGGGILVFTIAVGAVVYIILRDRKSGRPVDDASMSAARARTESTYVAAAPVPTPSEPTPEEPAHHVSTAAAGPSAAAPATLAQDVMSDDDIGFEPEDEAIQTTETNALDPVPGEQESSRQAGRSRTARVAVVLGIVVASILTFSGAALFAMLGMASEAAIVLVAAGLVLVVGGLAGRMRWMAVPVLVGALGLAFALAADYELKGGFGEFRKAPQSSREIPSEGYRLGAGKLVVDMRNFDWEETPVLPLSVEAGAGQVAVIVDEDVCVESAISVGAGQIILGGELTEGISVDAVTSMGGTADPRLVLDGHVAVGEFAVFSGDGFSENMNISTGDIDLDRQREISQAACEDRG